MLRRSGRDGLTEREREREEGEREVGHQGSSEDGLRKEELEKEEKERQMSSVSAVDLYLPSTSNGAADAPNHERLQSPSSGDELSSTISSASSGWSTPAPTSLPEYSHSHHNITVPDNVDVGVMLAQLYPSREQAIESLSDSIPHARKLSQMQESERKHQRDSSYHKKMVRRLSKDLYVILSWYALLQSALFTAVAQTSVFTCADWWGAASIAGMVMLGTLIAVLDKLKRMRRNHEKVLEFQARQNAVHDKIEELYMQGSACNIDFLQPNYNHSLHKPGIFFVLPPRDLLVLVFLIGFSILIIVTCVHMLCGPCRC